MAHVDPTQVFERLMALDRLSDTPSAKCLKWIAILIDCAGDLGRDDGIARALAWADELKQRRLTERQAVLLEYFRSNAWAMRQQAQHRGEEYVWEWDQPEAQRQILHLRRASRLPGFDQLPAMRKCQILTNLANRLNTLGRMVEAIAVWTRALSIDPNFGPALGNRGYAYIQYARCLYETAYRGMVLYKAYQDLSAATSADAVYSPADKKGAMAFFQAHRAEVEQALDIKRAEQTKVGGISLGTTTDEKRYREWVLREQLFLNPLNDLGSHSTAAADVLLLPEIVQPLDTPPALIAFFNQLKQEFVAGRHLLFQGLHANAAHYSDRRVTLVNTLDYPSYGWATEQVKAAYRIGYSILDKIAFLVNEYFGLGIRHTDVYFKTVWYRNRDRNLGIRPELVQARNWPLRGLFWLAKDLFVPELQDVMEPDAQELYAIRNRLEHSYLKIHDTPLPMHSDNAYERMWTDTLAYSIYRPDFEAKTHRVFRLARAALIYAALAIHQEERRRARDRPSAGHIASFPLPSVDDEWKR